MPRAQALSFDIGTPFVWGGVGGHDTEDARTFCQVRFVVVITVVAAVPGSRSLSLLVGRVGRVGRVLSVVTHETNVPVVCGVWRATRYKPAHDNDIQHSTP